MKTCFKCGLAKPPEEFYRHKMMSDGHLGKCKDCTKKDVLEYRSRNIERIREYDRQRSTLPHRKAKTALVTRRWNKRHPGRSAAHLKAQRRYRNPPECCEMCGEKKRLERHHPDYSLPLMIVWLCKPCHAKADASRRANEMAQTSEHPFWRFRS